MTLRIFMQPDYGDTPDRAEGGIRRVIEAMHRYLPDHDVKFSDLRRADLTVGHGVMAPRKPDAPFVSHNHGLHWSDYNWPAWAHDVNGAVVRAMVQAAAITVPSEWVGRALTRGLLRRPTVIYHGVDADEWTPAKQHSGYVLWNKARADPVSDPREMQRLARHMPDVQFVTTVGTEAPNVRVLGVLPLPRLKEAIQNAGVYLATARETFGIGTLEALASGVPVAGWDYGGQREIIKQGETGYLAPFGDYDALGECVRRCLLERERISPLARADVLARWGWSDKVAAYAALYKRVAAGWAETRPAVSVIVTCYNLAAYLPECLDSLLRQDFTDWECVIVDDCSTDGTPGIARLYAEKDPRFTYQRTDRNVGLSAARNHGASLALGRAFLFLDADDALETPALGLLARGLELEPETHIAYGSLALMQTDAPPKLNPWPSGDYDWRAQMAHANQLHYSALMRRAVWEEVGGYRERLWRAEDADFWCRATSFGFRARHVTEQPTLLYRLRSDSKGQTENRTYPDKDGPWTAGFPWRLANNYAEGVQKLQEGPGVPNAHLVPFAAQGKPTINRGLAWNVYHHEAPAVSVIIPVGPGHERYVLDALDSLVAQDVHTWEAVVVNDTGQPLTIPGAPFARIVSTGGKVGAGAARNVGWRAARAPLIAFLDADDWLLPGALRKMLAAYTRGDVAFVYSDYLWLAKDGRTEALERLGDYNPTERRMQHGITILIAKEHIEKAGGFDETMEAWEDWDFACRLAVAGLCGRRIPEGLFLYRVHMGQRRNVTKDGQTLTETGRRLAALLGERYDAYYNGEKKMSDCCPGGGEAILAAKRSIENAWNGEKAPERPPEAPTSGITPPFVRMEFVGERVGAVTYHGPSGREYRGGNNPRDRFIDALPGDAAALELMMVWKRVERPIPAPPAPPPPEPTVAFPTVDRTAVEPVPDFAAAGASAFSGNGEGPHIEVVAEKSKKKTAAKPKAKPRKKAAKVE